MAANKAIDKKTQKNILERLYKKYNHTKYIPPDPLQFVYRYKSRADMEIIGFLAALFAYGAVGQIEKFLTALLSKMGKSPAKFIKDFSAKDKKLFSDLKYRFNTSADIVNLMLILQKALNRYGSLENLFLTGYCDKDENIIPAAKSFYANLLKLHRRDLSAGLKFLISDPKRGGTCKRLFLFLRWMVRDDTVDTGLWKKIDKAKLIVPVDVHMGRLSGILQIHNRKTMNLRAAVEITKKFAVICPADPVKYDFALCRIGILENCNGKKNKYCPDCQLAGICYIKRRF